MRLRPARIFVVAMLVASVATVAPLPASAAASWSVVPSVSPPGAPRGGLAKVACPSETSCFAVGSGSGALVEHWDGKKWSIMAVAHQGAGEGLADIACPTTSFCVAIGGTTEGPLIEHWNGTAWSIVPGASAENAFLLSVACSNVANCFAVGAAGTVVTENTLIEHWDGVKWSIVPSPSVAGAGLNELNGVTCSSDTNCFSVGRAGNGITPRTLVERWNGTSWSIVAAPTPPGNGFPSLNAVSCSSDASCFAVGYSSPDQGERTLAERWDGTGWSIVASPNTDAYFGEYRDVSCTSATNCFATRAYANLFKPWHSAIDHWNGTKWSVSPSPSLTPLGNELDGIACASDTRCFAVGSTGTGFPRSVSEYWDGKAWSLGHQPLDPAPPNSTLAGAACASITKCFAVGHYTNSANRVATLIERPSGSSWAVVASPNKLGATDSRLSGVACPGPTLCFAVGTYTKPQHAPQTLIERWNGASWSIIASPNNPHTTNTGTDSLSGVSCASPKDCFAVGTYDNGTFKTLIMHWDGVKWAIVPSPNRARIGENVLAGVSCSTATSCFAVGTSSTDPRPNYRTLTERWNGKTWSIVASPGPGAAGADGLASVSCVNPKMCVAVGSSRTSTSESTLVERWNGAAWSRVTIADPVGATHSALASIWCASATSCVAVGGTSGSSGLTTTLVKRLTGTTWSSGSAATPTAARNSYLHAVSCPTSAACYAVGDYDTDGAPRTLVERSG